MIAEREYLSALLQASTTAECDGEEELADWLYTHGYVARFPVAADRTISRSIAEALSRANQGRSALDQGWLVESVPGDGSVIARKGTARRRFPPGEYLTLRGPAAPAAVDDPVMIYAAVEYKPRPADAFYFAFGESIGIAGPSENLIRVYWNVSAEGAPFLLASLSGEFNRFQTPFRFKCVHRGADFYRLDAAVLYVNSYYWPIVSKLVRRIYETNAAWLGPDTPVLTKRLAEGLALAEDPIESGSFGKHRCRILSRVAMKLREDSRRDPAEEIRRQFLDAQIDPMQTWLNPGSRDIYDIY